MSLDYHGQKQFTIQFTNTNSNLHTAQEQLESTNQKHATVNMQELSNETIFKQTFSSSFITYRYSN